MSKKRKQVSAANEASGTGEANDDAEESVECENRRGRTVAAVVGKAIMRGVKIPVEWNHNKVPVGKNRSTFITYIGVVARERVSINFRDWEEVPDKVLTEVFKGITRGFVVPEERRNYVLGRASIRWRAFKARLRKDWMYDNKGANKNVIKNNPPSIYPFISHKDWNKFIETYTHDTFKELSEKNRERAKKNTSRYRGGSKGYLYYEQQIAEEQGVQVRDVPRHLVWIRAHSKQKDGVITFDNPADFEIAQTIKALEAQQIQGEIDVCGRNDILARALKTPEHGGCVRGVGSGVTNTHYFGYNKPTPNSQLKSDLNCVKSKLENVVNTQNLLLSFLMSSGQVNAEKLKEFDDLNGNQVSHQLAGFQVGGSGGQGLGGLGSVHDQGLQGLSFQLASNQNKDSHQLEGMQGGFGSQELDVQLGDFGSGGDQRVAWHADEVYVPEFVPETEDLSRNVLYDEQVITDQPFSQGVDNLCSLAIKSDKGVDIVAVGEVYIGMEGEVVKHHFKPVPSGHYRVCLKEEINPNAPLPCPEGEIRFICQGKEMFFLWPTHLVFPIKKPDKQLTNEINALSPRSPSSQSSCTRKYTITPADKSKLTSSLVRVFKDVAIAMKMSGKTKSFTITARVFQNEQCLSLNYEDMLDWCFQREIRSPHMLILMLHLSEMVHTEGISGLYGFCDCNYLSPHSLTVEKDDDRCDYLASLFSCNDAKNRNQLFFAPYNEDGHWMLVVIYPWIGLVHWLDPAIGRDEPPKFAKTIINKAIYKFSVEHRTDLTKIKRNPYIKWKKIECPRQPHGCSSDSGYYVSRYMIEIIDSRQMLIPEKYFDKVPPTYSQQMIDELRGRWISYVTGYHQPNDDDDDLCEL